MGFGYRDSDWIDPPEYPTFKRNCIYCEHFIPCPCGCQWGMCGLDKDEMFDGTEQSCEEGSPIDGYYEEPEDEDAAYEAWKDRWYEE